MSAERKTDEELMSALREGHDLALAELVRRYQSDVIRFCQHYLKNAEEARELSQETFLRVFKARDRFDAKRSFRPWLLCIARNLCLNELNRKQTVFFESLEALLDTVNVDHGPFLQDDADGPLDEAARSERYAVLARVIDGLDSESRELIALRFFEQLRAREIAEVMGLTDGAVRTKLYRLLIRLREVHGEELSQM